MNAEDDLSDMEISDGDGDAGQLNFYDEVLHKIKQPPSFLSSTELIDISDASLVLVDGPKLKKENWSQYITLLRFCFDTRRKCNLEFFSNPGDKMDDGIFSREGIRAERYKFGHELAEKAIAIYNRLQKDRMLKLEKLIKVNFITWYGAVNYMTFSAINQDTGEFGIYQAALKTRCAGESVLGLFRDWSDDKILAVLSITGAEEDFAGLWTQLEYTLAEGQSKRALEERYQRELDRRELSRKAVEES